VVVEAAAGNLFLFPQLLLVSIYFFFLIIRTSFLSFRIFHVSYLITGFYQGFSSGTVLGCLTKSFVYEKKRHCSNRHYIFISGA
jgi:hypothetical protein